jgi:aspartate kinase
MTKIKIGGIIKSTGLSQIGVMCIPGQPGTAGQIMHSLHDAGINVEFIVQLADVDGTDHVVFCVDEAMLANTLEVLEDVRRMIGAQAIVQNQNVAIISVFGPDFRERPGIASSMFSALGAHGINILAISTSISTLSCVISSESLDDASTAIYEAFDLP